MTKTCTVCDQRHYAKGFCQRHYLRNHRHGSPLGGDPLIGKSRRERFWTRVVMTDECWLWTGAKTTAGYGSLGMGNRRTGYAHRYAYSILVGPVPDGLELDHLCRVRHCVRPDHLEPVTGFENKRRAHQRAVLL